jgi:predicted SAM-dependent methyltransferase
MADMPQAGAKTPELPEAGNEDGIVAIADIGCGMDSPYFGPPDKVRLVRFDGDERVNPDFRCDLRSLPVKDGTFDVVHARHVLEHFGRKEAPRVLREWLRVLRVGGELRLNMPNLLDACRNILAMETGEAPMNVYPWWQLYGAQATPLDRHGNGFTPRRLKALLNSIGMLRDIEVKEDWGNLAATAIKDCDTPRWVYTDEWYEIEKTEGMEMHGLNHEPEPAPEPETTPEIQDIADTGTVAVELHETEPDEVPHG